ncbi:MAG: putative ATP-dependent protease, partial [Proteobacteria bacterium]|nr:putative ATP-dependent protease [Pseudomonadota bacterium]
QPPAKDWCYIANFEQSSKPRALALPAGMGRRFALDMEHLSEELSTGIPATFEGEEYRTRAEEIEERARNRELKALNELRTEAAKLSVSVIETPTGFAFAPVDAKDQVMGPEQFEKLPEKEQHEIQQNIALLHQKLEKLLRQFPTWRKEAKEKLKHLNREFAAFAVSHLIAELKERYSEHPKVIQYLDDAERDIVDHAEEFFPKSESGVSPFGHSVRRSALSRYQVNLLVDHGDSKRAPIIDENLPSHANLIGRIEYQAQLGALLTDFTMIKPGALHLANGGYLILDARKLLMQPFAWETLKRSLQAAEIRIESLERTLSLVSTASLEPEPIPLDVKIILTGERLLYYLLSFYDPEFSDFFKVSADFEETMPRDSASIALYARVVASLARREKLRPLDKLAVLRVIEHSARLAADSEKLTTQLRSLNDLLKEADYWASQAGHEVIGRDDVETAIARQIHRNDRIRDRIYEAIQRGTIFIDTEGEAVGQINGLSVISLDDFSFGQPSRITATTRLGSGKVIDIERETELGGAIHSKGVMILSSFLASRYARATLFSVAVSLVFEQSYGAVEGDSASLAELCCIVSSLSGLPINQSFAVTGSVNQHGRVQPIGGVNEKIEGFFDVCAAKSLTGQQGVIIPRANVPHLMLRQDVVDAAKEGRFQVYAVETVDQALELLMGTKAGVADEEGHFPEGSIHARVSARLNEFTEIRQRLNQPEKRNGDNAE